MTYDDLVPSGTLAGNDLVFVDTVSRDIYRAAGTAEAPAVSLDRRLPEGPVLSMAAAADGTVFAATPPSGVIEADWPHATILTDRMELARQLSVATGPGWLALVPEAEAAPVVLPVASAATVAAARFGLTGNFTRITTGAPARPLDLDRRGTNAFLSAAPLPLHRETVPVPTAVEGATLHLDGDPPASLRRGQRIALQGRAMGARVVATAGGIYRLEGARAVCVGEEGQAIGSLAFDLDGSLLAGTDRGLVRVDVSGKDAPAAPASDTRAPAEASPGPLESLEWSGQAQAWSLADLPRLKINAIARSPGGEALVATSSGIYRSGGGGWHSAGLVDHDVAAVLTTQDATTYAGTRGGLLRIGRDRVEAVGLTAEGVTALAQHADGTLLAGTRWGIYRQSAADRWLEYGLNQRRITAIAAMPDGSVAAGTSDHGLHLTTDGGRVWQEIPTGIASEIRALAVDARGTVFVGTGDGLVLSDPVTGVVTEIRQHLLFRGNRELLPGLDNLSIPRALARAFEDARITLPAAAKVRALRPGALWLIETPEGPDYAVRDDGGAVAVSESLLFETLAAPEAVGRHRRRWTLRAPGGATGRIVASDGDLILDHAGPAFGTIGEVARLAEDAARVEGGAHIALARPLGRMFDAGTVVVSGNVADAVAGDSVVDEPLGSGDASLAGQEFVLKRPPLAYVGTDSGAAVSTLSVAVRHGPAVQLPARVGELSTPGPGPTPWREVPTFAHAAPDARVYSVLSDDRGRTRIRFGDGVNGARLPTGSENVVASYRSGGGSASNRPPGAIRRLAAHPPTVRAARNPVAATGGADPETLDAARSDGPRSTRTLGRVVAWTDYADFARLYPGIGRAAAQPLHDGTGWLIQLTVADATGASPPAGSILLDDLAAAIRRNRSGHVRVVVAGYALRTFDVAALVTIADAGEEAALRHLPRGHADHGLRPRGPRLRRGRRRIGCGRRAAGCPRCLRRRAHPLRADRGACRCPPLAPRPSRPLGPGPPPGAAGRAAGGEPGRRRARHCGGDMTDRLYELLPLIYRQKDQERGEPLRTLMSVLQDGFDLIDGDLRALYDDWFVETCDPAILPYLAALLDVSGVAPGQPGLPTDRRRVADAVAHRRRKGTLAALSNVLSDATGWGALVVEGFRDVAATQDLAFLRPDAARTVDLGTLGPAGLGVGPFGTAAHGFDARRGQSFAAAVAPTSPAAGGAYGPDVVSIYLWRLASQPVERQELRDLGHGRYAFHPLGVDTMLFAPPGRRSAQDAVPTIDTLPIPLTRRILRARLEQGATMPDLGLWLDRGSGPEPLPATALAVGDLSDWTVPPALGAAALVDPETGRLAFRDPPRGAVLGSFATGAVADLGGGPYDRAAARAAMGAGDEGRFVAGGPGASLSAALAAWSRAGGDGVILIADSRVHPLDPEAIEIPAGHRLSIIASNGAAPTLVGPLKVAAGAGATLLARRPAPRRRPRLPRRSGPAPAGHDHRRPVGARHRAGAGHPAPDPRTLHHRSHRYRRRGTAGLQLDRRRRGRPRHHRHRRRRRPLRPRDRVRRRPPVPPGRGDRLALRGPGHRRPLRQRILPLLLPAARRDGGPDLPLPARGRPPGRDVDRKAACGPAQLHQHALRASGLWATRLRLPRCDPLRLVHGRRDRRVRPHQWRPPRSGHRPQPRRVPAGRIARPGDGGHLGRSISGASAGIVPVRRCTK